MMHDNDDAAAMLPLSFPSFVLCTIVAVVVVVSPNLYILEEKRKEAGRRVQKVIDRHTS